MPTLATNKRARFDYELLEEYEAGLKLSGAEVKSIKGGHAQIDRAFVSALDSQKPGGRIAEMVVPLGHQLDMKVIAEGVETQQQADLLRRCGCDEAQGYLYAKPLPLDQLLIWLKGINT